MLDEMERLLIDGRRIETPSTDRISRLDRALMESVSRDMNDEDVLTVKDCPRFK